MQGRTAEAISCYEHVALLQPNSPEVGSTCCAVDASWGAISDAKRMSCAGR